MKTHSSCKKRFKKTSTGEIKRSKAFKRHHSWAKSPKLIRSLRLAVYLRKANKSNIARLMPY